MKTVLQAVSVGDPFMTKAQQGQNLASVAIILCHFNGKKYLSQQLASIKRQTHRHWHLFVFDDHSTQDTSSLKRYSKGQENITFIRNPRNLGPTKNFLHALHLLPDKYDFYAFCDQDDIWFENKIERAIAMLKQIDQSVPGLYAARALITDKQCKNVFGLSPRFSKKPSFKNALVQCIGGGNTMVMNRSAKTLIDESHSITDVPAHDWWVYILVCGAGGEAVFDNTPCLYYRQHGQNLTGSNKFLKAKIHRVNLALRSYLKSSNDKHLTKLFECLHLLTKENKETLLKFKHTRDAGFFRRIWGLFGLQLYRQSFLQTLCLYVLIAIRKL